MCPSIGPRYGESAFQSFQDPPPELFRRTGPLELRILGAQDGLEFRRRMKIETLPGKPVAYNSGLLSVNSGLLWSIVAYYFGLLGVPGS